MTLTTPIRQAVTALFLAGMILLASMLAVQKVENSSLYRQGRFIGSIIQQESVDIGELLGTRQAIQMTAKFAGAVTSAYINFELIPVNEANTFSVILEAVNDGIFVDRFEYHRRNLTIDGYADSQEDFDSFLEKLRDRQYFESVSGDFYITTDDALFFKIVCVSATF